jgi:hypothetical protein
LIEFIGVLAAFIIIFALALKKVNLGLVLLLASLILGLKSGLSAQGFLEVARLTVTDYTTWELILSIGFISILGNCLKETGIMVKLIESLRGLLSGRWLVALIPALFGLMPMPGGALMSAPFNEGEADRLGMNAEEKTFVNVWFRHVWFFASPIFTSVIMLSRVAKVDLYGFLALVFPLAFPMILIGYLFSMRGRSSARDQRPVSASPLAKGLLPVILIVVLNILGTPLPVAILVGLTLVLIIGRMELRKSISTITHGVHWDILAAMAGVMFFRYMIQESGSVMLLFSGLRDAGVPLLVLVTVFPFLIGFISGVPSSGIGIGIPLVMPLFASQTLSNLSVVYLSIVMGYMLSPLHLCLLLTNSYYRSSLEKVYRMLVPSTLIVYAIGLLYLFPQL